MAPGIKIHITLLQFSFILPLDLPLSPDKSLRRDNRLGIWVSSSNMLQNHSAISQYFKKMHHYSYMLKQSTQVYKSEFLQIIIDINRFLIGSPRGSPIGEGYFRPHPYVGILRHT